MSLPTSTLSVESDASRRRRWRLVIAGLLLGWASGLIIAIAIAAAIIEFGLFDVTALSSHSRPVYWAVHTTMIHAVRNASRGIRVPPHFTTQDVQQGFRIYDARCSVCHGGPGIARAQWVSGLTPSPSFLVEAARKWSPAELRFLIGKGVKMTAMPAWRLTLSDRDLWRVVAFLEKLPSLSQRDYRAMRVAIQPHASSQKAPR